MYLSPHKLQIDIAYDFNPSIVQSNMIQPNNFSSAVPSGFGVPPAPLGSQTNVEKWRVFLSKQKCESFQITLQEVYDPSMGVSSGAGLTLSGINLVVGVKKAWRVQSAATSVGKA